MQVTKTESDYKLHNKFAVEVLLRQTNTFLDREGKTKEAVLPSVPYSKLYSYASKTDKIYLYIGWIASAITGLGMPSFVFLIGNVINSFDVTNTDPQEMLD